MWKFILKRLIALIPVIMGVTIIVYFIMALAPGDPVMIILGDQATPEAVEALTKEMHLDEPIIMQYLRYIAGVARGNLGTSWGKKGISVSDEIFSRFPNTVRLAATASLITVCLAIPLGIFAAINQNTIFDGVSMVIALIGVSMPVFWLGIMLILLFSLRLGWFPTSGSEGWISLVLPGCTLGVLNMATIARTTRSSMLEVIRQDYIRTARSKGLSEGVVIRKHAVKNALIPTITMVGIQMGHLLGGSVLTESVFAWPGVGRYMVQAIQARDRPALLACMIMFSLSFSIINLVVDLCYGFVDPRIKSQYS